MNVITEQALRACDKLDGLYFAVAELLPPEFPYTQSKWENDDRSLAVPKTSGSAWFRVFEVGSETQIAYAFFAADSEVVRCDDVHVDSQHRLKGIANFLYCLAACIFEAPVVPSDRLLEDGKMFWKGRTEIVCQR